jgi:carbamoyl-phosphate synthase large subunit
VLVDRFLENAIELDVDALCDGSETYVAAVMEHIEEAGIHSGDSSCVLPAPSDDERVRDRLRRLGPALGVVGLLNVQLAIDRRGALRAGGQPARVADGAVRVEGDRRQPRRRRLPGSAAGSPLSGLALPPEAPPSGFHVKAAVLPFARFPGADPVLGPEMRSTARVMASAAGLPDRVREGGARRGRALPAGAVRSSRSATPTRRRRPDRARSRGLGFELRATAGTAARSRAPGSTWPRSRRARPSST